MHKVFSNQFIIFLQKSGVSSYAPPFLKILDGAENTRRKQTLSLILLEHQRRRKKDFVTLTPDCPRYRLEAARYDQEYVTGLNEGQNLSPN